ncbi:hypothetical protein F1721_28720 [Saccharopolyspora hirsuta]|uniref:Uncharacterized protein n=1 Tax=Saccharopolyspora hirsuta TaxID=1837 RepID=A0A5M7BFQ6_SACHI|nr:hypothetical protein [Saccharopolyspora hirsuta]KAA5828426.1 hypothetical protein F1721_28720 [Saccharopolyspora hirsuta]
MFELLSKLAEILSSYWERFLDGRRISQDARVAEHLVHVVVALQDVCVRGDRLLALAEGLLGDGGTPEGSAEFAATLKEQVRAVDAVRSTLDESRPLLTTVDPQFYLTLAPLVDRKSGLLTRWGRQASLSAFSTTTLFFLPAGEVARLVEIGRAIGGDGSGAERAEYVAATADSIRETRSREVRDIRRAAEGRADELRGELSAARADLARAVEHCSALYEKTEAAVGNEAMARLRRRLRP